MAIFRKYILWILIGIQGSLFSQDCGLTLSGFVYEEGTEKPLEFIAVGILDSTKSLGFAVTNADGAFLLENLCPGTYIIASGKSGWPTTKTFVTITRDTTIYLFQKLPETDLEEVIIQENRQQNASTQQTESLNREAISKESSKNLADMLETLSGVSTLKNGAGISKPVIHGLYGNRVTVLNNGIPQAGQQWGNDHAPEIDPNAATTISVVKGVGALRYNGNLGGVVIVSPGNIPKIPGLHSDLQYGFQSNGLGQMVSSRIEKSGKWADWRVTATGKMTGDRKAPDYYLTNTGSKEANIALQVDKMIRNKWSLGAYYSLFNTEIGILRGSHIGNTTDLAEAIGREEPFFTQPDFSYQIEAPRQRVAHHLLKFQVKYFFDPDRFVDMTYGGQYNQRKEFDVRRSGRSSIPALSLGQFTHFLQGIYHIAGKRKYHMDAGLQVNFIDNANDPATGILPLIPNYTLIHPASFLHAKKKSQTADV